MIPLKTCNCQTINIPKEKADGYNILKIKFMDKGVFSFSIERQITRFHKDLKTDHDMIENILFCTQFSLSLQSDDVSRTEEKTPAAV